MRADRLLSLLMLLQTRGRMTARQLALELEVSERTIYRDVDALSAAGVPVYGEAGPAGGYELLGSYRTNLTGLSEGEARALFMLNIPASLAKLGFGQDLKAAMLKLTAALPESRRVDEERVRQRYYIDPGWWTQGDEPLAHMKTIQQAIWDDRQISITYNPLFDVQIERVVEPYGLAARAGAWYLVFARQGRVRARRVSALLDVRLCSESFVRPADFNLGGFWTSYCAEEQELASSYVVTVRAHKDILPLLAAQFSSAVRPQLESPPCPEDGSRVLKLPFLRLEEARERLLPLGSAVEVLEPLTLRLSMKDMAERIARVYRE